MRRFSSKGIHRRELVSALKNEETVRKAIAADLCLLCQAERVNAAGLCEGCAANLTDEEWRAAKPWIEGVKR